MSDLSRRSFLGVLSAGGLLSLGFDLGCGGAASAMRERARETGTLTPNAFISVERSGRVVVEVDKAEIGQGITTMYATLTAEELDVPIDAIDVHLADSLPVYRTTTNMQLTGGSASTKDGYVPIRQAAAAARTMLVGAAASAWGVAPESCTTDGGHVSHAPSGRRIAYGELTESAARQPIPSSPRLKDRRDFKVIGKQRTRVDVRSKVDGTARFGIDVSVPGMVRACILHGPVYGAEAMHVDDHAARKMVGVLDVFAFPGGVAIVAEKYWQARAAAAKVVVAWDAGRVAGLDTEKIRAAVRAHEGKGDVAREDGDAEAQIARAVHQVEAFYEAPFLAHAPMEPQNCVVHVKDDGHVEAWAPCQSPSILQAYVADAIGVAQEDVLVHSTLSGGGFGRRIVADYAAQAAHISRRVKRPVQVVWSRESDMTQGYYRPQLAVRMRGGVSAEGQVTGVSAHALGQSIALDLGLAVRGAMAGVPHGVQGVLVDALRGMFATGTVPDMFATEGIRNTVYPFADFRVAFTPVMSKMPVNSWRSVGHSFNGFVMESFVDELAHAAKLDPLTMRRQLLPPSSRARRVLDAVAEMAGWGTRPAAGFGRGLARHESFETEVAEVVDVELVDGRIKVRRVYVVVDCGLVVNPDLVRAQVEGAIIFGLSAALDQQITLREGVVEQTNFDGFPPLRMFECPEIHVRLMESDSPPTGIGEPGLPPIAPAVASALFQLTGHRLRRLPLQRALDEVRR